MTARPFLKWVGGKSQLLKHLTPTLPESIETYYEAFTGGGALFFALAAERRFKRAVLNDLNRELIDTYTAIRDDPEGLIQRLKGMPYERTSYEQVRAQDLSQAPPVERAARMIYLNKTGFNGLYRVNSKNQFNVPFGKYTNPKICDEENIRACSEVLQRNVTLCCGDFATAVAQAGARDAVYFDPPYIPLTKTANFTSYTSDRFGLEQQQRLADTFRALHKSGATVVLSNSDTPETRGLYEGFDIRQVPASRSINSKGTKRGPVNEVIVVGAQNSA